MKPVAAIAFGGNSLVNCGDRGTFREQQRQGQTTCRAIVAVLEQGCSVVVTHGNGPRVSYAQLRAEVAQAELPSAPLDSCVAETQGGIDYLQQQPFENALADRRFPGGVVSPVTQVVAATPDPASSRPTKPTDPFFTGALAGTGGARIGPRRPGRRPVRVV